MKRGSSKRRFTVFYRWWLANGNSGNLCHNRIDRPAVDHGVG